MSGTCCLRLWVYARFAHVDSWVLFSWGPLFPVTLTLFLPPELWGDGFDGDIPSSAKCSKAWGMSLCVMSVGVSCLFGSQIPLPQWFFSSSTHLPANFTMPYFLNDRLILHCVNVPYFLHLFHWGTCRLFSVSGHYKLSKMSMVEQIGWSVFKGHTSI